MVDPPSTFNVRLGHSIYFSPLDVKNPHGEHRLQQGAKLRQHHGRCFFPQFDIEVQEGKMSQDSSHHLVMPSWILPDLEVIHTQYRFGVFKYTVQWPSARH
ncbi:MAG TPA: hypothetical protein DCZ69_19725 [Syntrophobacteraceae bacterium]|nr:hypothetical protein [Syntrophobacteraceae bacterium]HBD10485.1 hypothetical protein [Syntrophobacteraceae bacterium]HBZ56662.1 hypothetical protein [Syntrophobacteraceae bacterium]